MCALSADRQTVQPHVEIVDGKEEGTLGKNRHMYHVDGMPDYRFMLISKDVLDAVKKFDRSVRHNHGTGLPSSETRLRSYATAYLLKRIMRSEGKHTYSIYVDSFWNPEGLQDDILFHMKGEKKRFYVECGHEFDRKIPIVNSADALAYFHFGLVRDDDTPGSEIARVLDDLFPGKHVNIYGDHFFEGYMSATRRKATDGNDPFLNRYNQRPAFAL